MIARSLIFIFLLITAVSAVKKSYDGYKLYKVLPNSDFQVQILKNIQKNHIGEFWEEEFGINHEVKVMVSKEKDDIFKGEMMKAGVYNSLVIEDLQRVIEAQLKPVTRNSDDTPLLSMNWSRYHSLEEINAWFDELELAYPGVVTSVIMGQSFEGRNITGIKINFHPEKENKLIGMLEGGLHAREWISPATVTWIIKEFLINTDPEVRALAENFEWHMFPVVNPDGYSYTFTDVRMWRKNRNRSYNTTCEAGDDMSNGVDLNRNFGFMWNTIGASDDPCSNTYAGPEAFSELEPRAISQYVMSLKDEGEFIYYIAFHSYTQLVIVPYSHVEGGSDVLQANNFADMYEIAVRGVDRLEKRFGTYYTPGISADVMYPMSGTSFDWVKAEADVPVSYLIELRDRGDYGFLLPAEQIIPSNLEIMDFLLEMDGATRELKYYYSGTGAIQVSQIVFLYSLVLYWIVN